MKEITKIVVTAYGIAKKYGYAGTEADFAAQLLSGNGVLTIGNGLRLEDGVLSINGAALEDELNELIAGAIDEAMPDSVSIDEVDEMINSVFHDDENTENGAENDGATNGEE